MSDNIKLPVRAEGSVIYDAKNRPVIGIIASRNEDTSVVDRMLVEDEARQVAAALNATATAPTSDPSVLRETALVLQQVYEDIVKAAESVDGAMDDLYRLIPDRPTVNAPEDAEATPAPAEVYILVNSDDSPPPPEVVARLIAMPADKVAALRQAVEEYRAGPSQGFMYYVVDAACALFPKDATP